MGRPITATVLSAALAGCYAPAAVEGLPCGTQGACPDGQRCDEGANRCYRTPPGGMTDALGDAATDAPFDAASPTTFIDDFTRPDGALGNGWLAKTPGVWSLAGGEVVKVVTNATDYRDNLVYRPASEDLADVAISVEVTLTDTLPGYAQIFARAVSATITTPDAYDGYILYLVGEETKRAVLGRQRGTPFVVLLAELDLTLELDEPGQRIRMSLAVAGDNPVQLAARIERRIASSWDTIGEAEATDSSAARVTGPGTVGFSGSDEATYRYDNFLRAPLSLP